MSKIYHAVVESDYEKDQSVGYFSSREKALEACERYVTYANENLSSGYEKVDEGYFVVYENRYGEHICIYEHEIDRDILLEELKEEAQ